MPPTTHQPVGTQTNFTRCRELSRSAGITNEGLPSCRIDSVGRYSGVLSHPPARAFEGVRRGGKRIGPAIRYVDKKGVCFVRACHEGFNSSSRGEVADCGRGRDKSKRSWGARVGAGGSLHVKMSTTRGLGLPEALCA